ncbi:MAG: GNAT family N-acetyltransferase [Thermoplasmata archaeon]
MFIVMQEIKIRNATMRDKPRILEFCKNTWQGMKGLEDTQHDYIAFVYDAWVRKKSMITAEIDHRPVAILNVNPYKDGSAWLEGMRVDPEYRRKGIASMLTSYVLEKYPKVRLSIFDWNEPSKKLAETLGAKMIDTYIFINLDDFKYKTENCKFAKVPERIFALTDYGKKPVFVDWNYFYPDLETIKTLVNKRCILEDYNGFGFVLRSKEDVSLIIDHAVKIDRLVNSFCTRYKNRKKLLILSSTIYDSNNDFPCTKTEKLNIYEISR